MQEHVDEGRIFDLSREAELGLVEARFAPAVAFPIRILPLPIASVVLGHLLGLAVSGGGRHRPLDHRFVDHSRRDRKVCVLVVAVRNIRASVFKGDFDIARNADEAGPCAGIAGVEGRKRGVEGSVGVEADAVDVVAEGIVTDDAVDTELEAGKAAVEVGVRIPVTVVTLGLEIESTANARIGDNDVQKRHASRLGEVETEGVVFVLEFDKSVIEHVKAEIGDLIQIGGSNFDANGAEVVTSFVVRGVLRNEPRLVVEQTAVDAVIIHNAEPLVASLTNVVGAKELFVDVLGDASIRLFKLEDLFSGEEAIEKALHANPIGSHFLAEKLESVAFSTRTFDNFGFAVARVGIAVGVNDLAERSAGIVETASETERFLLGGVIERPCLLIESGEIRRVGDELFHIKVVEIFTSFAEETVNLGARIEIELFAHSIDLVSCWFGFGFLAQQFTEECQASACFLCWNQPRVPFGSVQNTVCLRDL